MMEWARVLSLSVRYLTPLAKAGYIAAVDTENLHSPQRKYRLVVNRENYASFI